MMAWLECLLLTCILRRNPAWLKELKLKAIVIITAATVGVFAYFKHNNDTPGPMKPMDCHEIQTSKRYHLICVLL